MNANQTPRLTPEQTVEQWLARYHRPTEPRTTEPTPLLARSIHRRSLLRPLIDLAADVATANRTAAQQSLPAAS